MSFWNITPAAKTIPPIAQWQPMLMQLPLQEHYRVHEFTLLEMEEARNTGGKLDPDDVYSSDNFSGDKICREVFEYQKPLRKLLMLERNDSLVSPDEFAPNAHIKGVSNDIRLTSEWLTYWEIYNRSIVKSFSERLTQRRAVTIEKKIKEKKITATANVILRGLPVRSFHISDYLSSSITPLGKTLNHIESISASSINWSWLATYLIEDTKNPQALDFIKDKSHWILGADGEGRAVPGNMRSWRNKISTTLKVVDIVVSNNPYAEDIPAIIAFTLINLAPSGYAIIRLPKILTAATVSMIHLFSLCFETTNIFHTLASDRLFLCGEVFSGDLNAKHHKILFDFIEKQSDSPELCLFSAEYVNAANAANAVNAVNIANADVNLFTNTVETLLDINRSIFQWRYEKYSKIVNVAEKIRSSPSSRTFTNYAPKLLAEEFPDQSKVWAAAVEFGFFKNLDKL